MVLGAADGDGADLAGAPTDEAVDGLLGDEKGGTAVRFAAEGSLEDDSIDELEPGLANVRTRSRGDSSRPFSPG